MFRSIDPKFAASDKPVANLWNVLGLSLFRYNFGRFSSGLAELEPVPLFFGGSLAILIGCMIFCYHS